MKNFSKPLFLMILKLKLLIDVFIGLTCEYILYYKKLFNEWLAFNVSQ